jgi:ribulose 1,5-bisphosphate synthetase/thiazole synthase
MMARSSFSSDNDDKVFDVVIVGAGIIGLTVARQFLMDSDLSVAIIDKGVPCSGATGAGIPYILFTTIVIVLVYINISKLSSNVFHLAFSCLVVYCAFS